MTELFPCDLGVLQGECLSPLFFALFLNDLESYLENNGGGFIELNGQRFYILLYADDCVLLSENAEGLQKSLDLLGQYCDEQKLVVNLKKSNVLVFRKGGIIRRKWFYKNEEVCVTHLYVSWYLILRIEGWIFEGSGESCWAGFKSNF